jgi:hypothetical protein
MVRYAYYDNPKLTELLTDFSIKVQNFSCQYFSSTVGYRFVFVLMAS